MSGPYECFTCGGTGYVEVNFFTEEIGRCSTCNGTGERWLETVFSPSQEDRALGRVEYVEGKWRFKEGQRPKGWPYEGAAPFSRRNPHDSP
jgi:hypothetical protein